MNEPTRNDAQDAATEAAQNAVDETTSWEYSAERGTIQADLEKGLDAAGVDVSDEHSGGPEVDPAEVSPADGA
jgi:hypothetical protein